MFTIAACTTCVRASDAYREMLLFAKRRRPESTSDVIDVDKHLCGVTDQCRQIITQPQVAITSLHSL